MAETSRSPRVRLARTERREQILAAAARAFSDRDPALVTFEEIADAAGVSRALVYNYFGDRQGLLEALYLQNADALRVQVEEAVAASAGARDALRAAVSVHVQEAAADPQSYRYAAGRVPFATLAELREQRVASLTARLGGSAEAELVALGLLCAIESMVLRWLDLGARAPEAVVELITGLLADGLTSLDLSGLAPVRS